jgi:hypothetical protein
VRATAFAIACHARRPPLLSAAAHGGTPGGTHINARAFATTRKGENMRIRAMVACLVVLGTIGVMGPAESASAPTFEARLQVKDCAFKLTAAWRGATVDEVGWSLSESETGNVVWFDDTRTSAIEPASDRGRVSETFLLAGNSVEHSFTASVRFLNNGVSVQNRVAQINAACTGASA